VFKQEKDAMNIKMNTVAITVLGATFGFGFTASADLIIGGTAVLTLESKTPYSEVDIHLGSTTYHDVKAAKYNWTNGLSTFCAQLSDSISVDQTATYDVVAVSNVPSSYGTLGAGRATIINDLYSRYFDYFEEEGWNYKRAAAFQVVLWEITHETEGISDGDSAADIRSHLDIEEGYASFDNMVYAVDWRANYLLDTLGGEDGETFLNHHSLVGITSEDAQDHIAHGSNPQTVPGALGIASGLGLLGLRRRRSRRA
jgi:hypothetical protein